MTTVLWVLAVPTLAFGAISLLPGVFDLPSWLDGEPLRPSLSTALLGTGLALVGVAAAWAAWRRAGAARAVPFGAVVAQTARGGAAEPALVEATAQDAHLGVYGSVGGADDPADPGRLLLGPLHPWAARGFAVDALYAALFVRPVLAAASLVRFLDREVIETYVRGAGGLPGLLGRGVRRAQTGNVQTYVGVLLAGSVVLAVLVAAGA
jgi:NADH-quinone oxidoreductase subunit L